MDGFASQIAQHRPPLVLAPNAPLESAREIIDRQFREGAFRTLHHHQGTFYRWARSHYIEESQEVMRANVYRFLDGAQIQKNGEMAPFNPNISKVAHVLEALAAETQLPSCTRAPEWIEGTNQSPATEILPCRNGLLYLPTRKLIGHSPAFFGLNAVDYDFHREASEPVEWLAFLRSIWGEDTESIETLQELFGLLLTPDTSHQKAFLIVGPKRSGKGTIARVLTAMLGRENVAGPTLGSLAQNFGLAPLIGKSLAVVSDARLGGRPDAHAIAERLLAITGEDSLTIDRKYCAAWTGRLLTRFLVLTNELPRLTDSSGALASRFIVLVMGRTFFGQEDRGLTDRLLHELPGILLWAIDGRDRLSNRGHFPQPESACQTVQELEDLGSPIGTFVRERCVVDPHRSVECSRLYNAWVEWCREQGRDHPGTAQIFGRDLHAAVPCVAIAQNRKAGARRRCYQGVDLDS